MSRLSNHVLADIEQKGIWRILLEVEKEDKYIRELLKLEGIGQGALYSALRVLLDYELVTEYRDTYNSRMIKITEKGRKIASLIKQIQKELLKGTK